MRIQKRKTHAILTGDVVGSGKLTAAKRRVLHRALGEISTRVQRTFPDACPLALDVFRGDGWQLLVTSPPSALRVALFVRASLRELMDSRNADTRISIGIGTIQFIPGEEVSEGDGPAYRHSGQGLDSMPRQVRLGVRGADRAEPGLLDAVLVTTDALSRRWTASQSRAVRGALTGRTQEAIGGDWQPEPITQQAVAQHLERASWYAVERALVAFERSLDPRTS